MIRVMHVVLGMDIGGLEAFVADLCDNYSTSVDSLVVCLRGEGDELQAIPGARIVSMNGPERFSLRQVFALRSMIRQEKIDIVHTHNPGPHLYGALAGRLSGRPVIHTKHGRNYPTRRKKVWLNRIATLFTDRIVAVSLDAEHICRDVEGVASRKLATILNGVDVTQFCPRPRTGLLRETLGLDAAIPIVGIVARLSLVKNHPLLFRSIGELKRRGIPVALCVVGDGPQRQALHSLVEELELQNSVFFLGASTEVQSMYPEFDVFVLSSRSEGISLTLLEAMSCELPVVATRVGGNPEVVEDGVTGALVEEDEQAIAGALEHLLVGEGAAERRRLQGRNGRARVEALFTMDVTASKYLQEYSRLVAEQKGEQLRAHLWKSQ